MKKSGHNVGSKNPRWNGGRQIRTDGYVFIYSPNHPHAIRNFVLEHRLVMENHLGRFLKSKEIVHHKNENRSDNRLCNLELMDQSRHATLHGMGHRRTPVSINKSQRRFIIRHYRNGKYSITQMAKKFKVSQSAIYNCYERYKNGLDY